MKPDISPLRRSLALLTFTLLASAVLLAGCASPPPAPPMLYLPTAPDTGLDAAPALPASAMSAGTGNDWRLVTPIALPGALDRDGVMVATAPGQWQTWLGLRWAEPLRDALPRVLTADLSLQRQAPVWSGRAAPGVTTARELRVDIDDWEASVPRAAVSLRARWALSAPDARVATLRGVVSISQPWTGRSAASLVEAQRAALRELAAGIVAQSRAAASTTP